MKKSLFIALISILITGNAFAATNTNNKDLISGVVINSSSQPITEIIGPQYYSFPQKVRPHSSAKTLKPISMKSSPVIVSYKSKAGSCSFVIQTLDNTTTLYEINQKGVICTGNVNGGSSPMMYFLGSK